MPRDPRTTQPQPDAPAAGQPLDERPTDEPEEPWPLPGPGLPDGAPEADVLEQSLPVGDPAVPDFPRVSELDGSEADILEQHMPVPLEDDDEPR